MKLFRKLFAEKILRFYEGTESGIRIIKNLPVIRNRIKEDSFGEESKSRLTVGIIAQIVMVFAEFARRFIYVALFMHLPYVIMSHFCPLIKMHEDITMIFLFVMLSTICGSLVNTTIFAMGDRDYLMIRVMLVSPYMNFLGKFIYKLVSEFVYYFIILVMFRVPVINALMLCLLTTFARPLGEMYAIITFDHLRRLYENRSVLNGVIMAVCTLLAYGLPLINKSVSATWVYAVHPFVVAVFFFLGVGAMYFLWWYKYYRVIIREAMHKKRED